MENGISKARRSDTEGEVRAIYGGSIKTATRSNNLMAENLFFLLST